MRLAAWALLYVVAGAIGTTIGYLITDAPDLPWFEAFAVMGTLMLVMQKACGLVDRIDPPAAWITGESEAGSRGREHHHGVPDPLNGITAPFPSRGALMHGFIAILVGSMVLGLLVGASPG
jgi:hypothetical protein